MAARKMAARKTTTIDAADTGVEGPGDRAVYEAAADASQLTRLADNTVEEALFDDWESDDVIVAGEFDSDVWDESAPLVGFKTGVRLDVGPHSSAMYELDTRGGLVSVWGATVLDSKMGTVPTGALVRIEYLGERTGKESTYKDYSVKYKILPGTAPAPVPAVDAPPF